MMLSKERFHCFLKVLLIICTSIRQSYQQNKITPNGFHKDLTFCIQNHTMSNTLQTFWHDVNADCELDSKSLIDLYSQLLERSHDQHDQCFDLLKHQLRKMLIQVISTQLEESLVIKSLKTNRELKQNLKHLQELDIRLAQILWERVINEVFLFVEPEGIINEIIQTKEQKIKFAGFQSLLHKYFNSLAQQSDRILPLLSYHIYNLFEDKSSSLSFVRDLQRLYQRLPTELRYLCEATNQQIGLLNYQHLEYLYAPRENGPDSERRVALTWTETKNFTDSDGHLSTSFNNQSLVAFGSRFGSALKFLYVDKEHEAAYFWIGSGLKSNRWWQILWPHEPFNEKGAGYILFRNEATEELLCATTAYDENRRYVTLLNADENMENSACFWLVTRF